MTFSLWPPRGQISSLCHLGCFYCLSSSLVVKAKLFSGIKKEHHITWNHHQRVYGLSLQTFICRFCFPSANIPPLINRIVLDHETSRGSPMLFPRAHTVPPLCASLVWRWLFSLSADIRGPIELARRMGGQTASAGVGLLTTGRPL